MINLDKLHKANDFNTLLAAFLAMTRPTYEDTLKAGKLVLTSVGIDNLATNAAQEKAKIEKSILENWDIDKHTRKLFSTERKRLQKLTQAAKFPTANLAYWYLADGKKIKDYERNNAVYQAYDTIKAIRNEAYTKVGSELQSKLYQFLNFEGMPLSKAVDLSLATNFTKEAETRFARQKTGDYQGKSAKSDVIRDVATFYRMISFSGEPITLMVDKGRSRAHFRASDRTINVGKGLDKETLWHELAHSIEYDHPDVLDMAKSFLHKRLEDSNGIRPLVDIYRDSRTPNNYSSDEVAIDDGAYSPYATKFYNHKNPFNIDEATATEVLTMGFQCFISPQDMGMLAVNDPEHFEFMLTVIKHLREKAGY